MTNLPKDTMASLLIPARNSDPIRWARQHFLKDKVFLPTTPYLCCRHVYPLEPTLGPCSIRINPQTFQLAIPVSFMWVDKMMAGVLLNLAAAGRAEDQCRERAALIWMPPGANQSALRNLGVQN